LSSIERFIPAGRRGKKREEEGRRGKKREEDSHG
jgi:hypothetical protein